MSDKQRHLVIILSILFTAIICVAIIFVGRFFLQGSEESVEEQSSLFSEAVQSAEGVRIIAVAPESPANKAEVPLDAILIGIDGRPIASPQDVVDYMQSYQGDGYVVLTLKETDALTTKTLQLAPDSNYLGLELLPTSQLAPTPTTTPEPETEPLPTPDSSLVAPPIINEVIADSVAANAGLQIGDVITAIDDQAVLNNAELIGEIASRSPGTAVRLTIRRGENTLVATILLGTHPDDETRPFLGVSLQEQ